MDNCTSPEVFKYVTLGKDAVLGLSAAAAAFFAYLGLSAWRRELKGKAEYELAKTVLKSVYKVRDAFNHVRGNAIYQYEYPEEMRDHRGHLKKENEYAGTLYVYEKRWAVLAEAFRELEENHLLAQVEWGPQLKEIIYDLRGCKIDLQISIERLLDQKRGKYTNSDNDDWKENMEVLYYHDPGSKYGSFTLKIQSALNKFEDMLRPHIKR